MTHAGKNLNNKNAALKPGERKRVNFTASVSGERILHLIAYIKDVSGDESEPTDEQLVSVARQLLLEAIDALPA